MFSLSAIDQSRVSNKVASIRKNMLTDSGIKVTPELFWNISHMSNSEFSLSLHWSAYCAYLEHLDEMSSEDSYPSDFDDGMDYPSDFDDGVDYPSDFDDGMDYPD